MRRLLLIGTLSAMASGTAAVDAVGSPFITVVLAAPGGGIEVPLSVPAVRTGDALLFHASVDVAEPRGTVPALGIRSAAPVGFRAWAALRGSTVVRGRARFSVDAVLTGIGDSTAAVYGRHGTWRRQTTGGSRGVVRVRAQATAVGLPAAGRRSGRTRGVRTLSVARDSLGHPAWHCRRVAGRPGGARERFGDRLGPEPFVGDPLSRFSGTDVGRLAVDAYCGASGPRLRSLARSLHG